MRGWEAKNERPVNYMMLRQVGAGPVHSFHCSVSMIFHCVNAFCFRQRVKLRILELKQNITKDTVQSVRKKKLSSRSAATGDLSVCVCVCLIFEFDLRRQQNWW
jgi:hypothetical protein